MWDGPAHLRLPNTSVAAFMAAERSRGFYAYWFAAVALPPLSFAGLLLNALTLAVFTRLPVGGGRVSPSARVYYIALSAHYCGYLIMNEVNTFVHE